MIILKGGTNAKIRASIVVGGKGVEEKAVLEQRIISLEKRVGDIETENKELRGKVNDHAVTIAEIKVIVQGLQTSWSKLENDIRQALENKSDANTSAFKDIIIEVLKYSTIIIGAAMGIKLIN